MGSKIVSGKWVSGGSNNTEEQKQNAGDPNKRKGGEQNEGPNNTEEQKHNAGEENEGPTPTSTATKNPTSTETTTTTTTSTLTSTSNKTPTSTSTYIIKTDWECFVDPELNDAQCHALQYCTALAYGVTGGHGGAYFNIAVD